MESLQQIKNAFNRLTFKESTHQYFVDGKPLKTSVSGLIKKFTPEVNFKEIAKAIDKRDALPSGATSELWKLKSDAACSKGTKVHYFGELYAFHRNIKPTCNQEKAIVAFWRDLPKHIIPVFTELQMYHFERMFGGTADIILYNTETKKFIIADYKTNEDLFKNFNEQKLKAPFHYKLNNAYNKYQIQFSLYQILFEQTGFEVEKRCLIWLKNNATYEMFFTEDYTEPLKIYLK